MKYEIGKEYIGFGQPYNKPFYFVVTFIEGDVCVINYRYLRAKETTFNYRTTFDSLRYWKSQPLTKLMRVMYEL